MAKIREQMGRKQTVGTGQRLHQAVIIRGEKLILILLDYRSHEVTIVMEHDGDDGETAQGGAFGARKERRSGFHQRDVLFRWL